MDETHQIIKAVLKKEYEQNSTSEADLFPLVYPELDVKLEKKVEIEIATLEAKLDQEHV